MSSTADASSSRAERRGLIYGLVGVVIFGLTLPMSRLAVLELDPIFVALGRALIAAICSAAYLLIVDAPRPQQREWPRLAAFSFCVVVIFPVLMTVAMRYAPSAHGGIVLGVMPLLTAMASVLVAGERPSPAFWICGIVGTAAVATFALLASNGAAEIHWADLLLALAAIAGSLGYALGGELTRRMGGAEVISWALVVISPVVIVMLLVIAPPINWTASPRAWAGMLYVAIFSQFLGFFAWNYGLALGGIARVGQVQLLQTFVTLAGAALILGEHITTLEIGFAVLVVAIVAAGWRTRVVRKP
jgi:drug/metabolite transporter (DMT)-like permease